MPALTVDIEGIPIAQGSLVSNGFGRGLRHSNDKDLKPWRYLVSQTINQQRPSDWDPTKPISVTATIRFPRPLGHFGTGRNAGILKPSAPEHHFVKPDTDKVMRALGDSIEQSGLIKGDQQITSWNVAKRYCIDNEPPGVLLTLISL